MVSLTYAALNVLRRPFHAAGLSLLELFGIPGIFGAIGISYLVTGAAAWWVIERVLESRTGNGLKYTHHEKDQEK